MNKEDFKKLEIKSAEIVAIVALVAIFIYLIIRH